MKNRELVRKLANEFSKRIRLELTAEQVESVNDLDREKTDGCCSTHDFIDANIVMHEAFLEAINPTVFELDNDIHLTLWGEAWCEAKAHEFHKIEADKCECGETCDDGEGWNGKCGSCADKEAEADDQQADDLAWLADQGEVSA